MERLEQKHIDFLRTCAASPNRVHSLPEGIDQEDANQLANEGLLVKYNKALGPQYSIARYGAQFVKEFGATETPEMRKLAVDYVVSKGYSPDAAEEIVTREGVGTILYSQAEELRKGNQREVQPPTDANGNVKMQYKG